MLTGEEGPEVTMWGEAFSGIHDIDVFLRRYDPWRNPDEDIEIDELFVLLPFQIDPYDVIDVKADVHFYIDGTHFVFGDPEYSEGGHDPLWATFRFTTINDESILSQPIACTEIK